MRIGYDEECGSVVIVGRDVFPACALRATMDASGKIRVSSLAETAELYTDWFRIETMDGRTFDTPEDAKAYVDGVLMRRPTTARVIAEGVAISDIAAGMPVAISRFDGSLVLARADTYAQAFVVGIAAEAIEGGFAGTATRDPVTLVDWSPVAGSPSLAVGQPYFLAPEGGLTLSPNDPDMRCAVRVGNAVSRQTFAPVQADPILL